MKKSIRTYLMALFMMALVPLLSPAVNTIIYNATYDFSKLTSGTDTLGGVTYTTVNYEGLSNDGEPGKPSLPVDYIKFSVPYNATNFTVTATLQNNLFSNIGSFVLYPCQPERLMNDTTPIVITPPDNSIYNSNSYYPSQNAWVVDEGFLAGENHIVTVAVMPVSYKRRVAGNTLTNQLKKSQTVSITLSYNLSDTLAMYPIVCSSSTSKTKGQLLTQSMVVNPSSVSLFAPYVVDTLHVPYHAPQLNTGLDIIPYIIITTNELSHSLRRLVALKRQKGYKVKLVTLNEVIADPYAKYGDIVNTNGQSSVIFDDDAGKIRQYLKLAHYYNSSKYLLLAGTDVPFRIKNDVPTDLYYSDLNSNWSGSKIDKHQEFYTGRLLAKTESQIANYTDKLFRYELNPGNGDYSYLQRALYTESVDMFQKSKGLRDRLYSTCNDTTVVNERYYGYCPKADSIINLINNVHFSFWGTFNHGEPSNIATYGVMNARAYSSKLFRIWTIDTVHNSESSYSPQASDRGLNNMMNKEYPMLSYSISCTTMPYDNYKSTFSNMPMNFGESFITGKDYGGPAYLGNTRPGYISKSSYLSEQFGKAVNNGFYKIGEAEALSKCYFSDPYPNDNYIPMVHNLLGDPTLEIWSDTPQVFSNIGVSRTDNSIFISGIDTDSTVVAYYNNDGQIGTDTISTSNIIINNISPNSSIMLYKHNHIPYIVPMSLQNIILSNSQYVIASDVRAGNSIDLNRSIGDVIVPNGVEYEIENSGTVTFEDGFKVEKGAFFAVYPSCF